MKRLLLVLAAGLLLAIFGPVPAVAAHRWWPWGHHSHSKPTNASSNPAPAAATPKNPKAKKQKKDKVHHEKHSGGNEPLYTVPKTVGWWHKGPGPAGAGS